MENVAVGHDKHWQLLSSLQDTAGCLLTALLLGVHPYISLVQDMQRPLYMQPKDAMQYGIIDNIVTPEKQIIDNVKSADQWDKEAGLVPR